MLACSSPVASSPPCSISTLWRSQSSWRLLVVVVVNTDDVAVVCRRHCRCRCWAWLYCRRRHCHGSLHCRCHPCCHCGRPSSSLPRILHDVTLMCYWILVSQCEGWRVVAYLLWVLVMFRVGRVVWGRNGGGGGKEGSDVATGFRIWDDAGCQIRKVGISSISSCC